ncbi:GPCR family 3 [Fasciola hepatica]|uniref:GPCR family 3 n=1 Tax=Fasciola hepatica TaxID=6192 RepID=A0A4E0RWB7_FASHE|nr:GPCR family 3 [Fasciola hepatica]
MVSLVWFEIRMPLSQTVVLVAYLLFNPWICCHCAVEQSKDHNTPKEATFLHNFVQYIHSHRVFCSPTFAFSTGDAGKTEHTPLGSAATHDNPAAPIDVAVTFHPVFSKLFSPGQLTRTYFQDVRNAVQLAQVIHRFQQNTNGLNPTQANNLIRSFLTETGSVLRWDQKAWIPDFVPASSRLSNQTLSLSLLGIGICEQSRPLGYVTSASSVAYSVSVRAKICAESNGLQVPQQNQFTFSTMRQEKFTAFWLANQCESVPEQLSLIRLSVHPPDDPKKIHFLFEFDVRNVTVNQCALGIHQCAETTKCEYKQYGEWPFSMDNYLCACEDGYYVENEENGFPAPYIRSKSAETTADAEPQFHCRACPVGCGGRCGNNMHCRVRLDLNLFRAIPLAVQSFCITACILIGIALCRLRKTRVVKSSNWLLLEILLVGAIFLYLIIVVMYFPASEVTCILSPWLRELGFAVMYGVLIVKIYRVLCGFQSRKAHRVHVRDKDILKFLGLFIITSFTYMVAWTAVNLDYLSSTPWSRNPEGTVPISMLIQGSLVKVGQTHSSELMVHGANESGMTNVSNLISNGMTENRQKETKFDVCRSLSWDVIMGLAEFIILAVSIHYCRLVRTAPSEYNEVMYISIALIIEMTVSGIFNIIRHFIWYSVHPDYMFLLYFLRSHITVTINLALIFGPKAWYLYRPINSIAGTGRVRTNPVTPYSADPNLASTGKLNLTLNGDLDIADVNLADMDPEVIRRHHGQSGNVPLMIQTESGYCWADCRSGRSAASCSKRDQHTGASGCGGSSSGSGGRGAGGSGGSSDGAGRMSSFYAYSSVVHDEEVSKLSEESTNSADDTPLSANLPHSQQQGPKSVTGTTCPAGQTREQTHPIFGPVESFSNDNPELGKSRQLCDRKLTP